MTTNTTAHSLCCRLSRDPAQVRHAREQAGQALSRWGLGEHADLAELIVSELATNAIRHGHGAVRVCVSYAHRHLRVDVHDDGAGRPARQQATPDDESGRGLALLDGLIGLHGGRRAVANDITGHGKTIYVEIGLATDPASVPVTGAPADRAPTAHTNHAGKPPGLVGRRHGAASWPVPRRVMCEHAPPCPAADTPDRAAARVIAFHPEQGWNLLCNGIVAFDDTGALLPDGTVIEPHRAASRSPGNGLLPNQARPRGTPCRTDAPVRERRAELRGHCPVRRGPPQSPPLTSARFLGRACPVSGGRSGPCLSRSPRRRSFKYQAELACHRKRAGNPTVIRSRSTAALLARTFRRAQRRNGKTGAVH